MSKKEMGRCFVSLILVSALIMLNGPDLIAETGQFARDSNLDIQETIALDDSAELQLSGSENLEIENVVPEETAIQPEAARIETLSEVREDGQLEGDLYDRLAEDERRQD